MNTLQHRFIEPLDLLFLRGNKLFGDPGSFGESLIPPNPSVIAGALRSHMLTAPGFDLNAFAAGTQPHPELGTPENPGPFTVTDFRLARRNNQAIETLYAPPADLIITAGDTDDQATITRLQPAPLAHGIASSTDLPYLPLLAQPERTKPAGGYWLTADAWQAWLNGNTPAPSQLVKSSDLWATEPRVGVGLDPGTRSVDTGKLFSSEGIALKNDVGFLVSVASEGLPASGILRLGGDGRGAAMYPASPSLPEPNYDAIAAAGRCRIILTSPGIFADGWKLPGVNSESRLNHADINARLMAAAVPRHDIVSGWDLASNQPKPAQRVAPAGSVYWLNELEATPEALRHWMSEGLWQQDQPDLQRKAEGFNRFTVAAY